MSKRIVLSFFIPILSFAFVAALILSLSPSMHAQNAAPNATIPDITVTSGTSSPSVRNGEKVTFTVEVKNVSSFVANNITVTEFLPLPYVQFLSCQTDAPAGCKTEGPSQIITFPSIAAGQSKLITFVTQARSNYLHSTTTNHRSFVSSGSGDSNLLNNKDKSAIEFLYPVDLQVTRQITSPVAILSGGTVTLLLNVKNVDVNPIFGLQYHNFKNPASIVMSDTVVNELRPALTYPSAITVAGITQPVVNVEVSLYAISRTWTEDIDMLLVSPSGVSVTLLSDVGGATDLGGVDLEFSDSADKDATNQDTIPAGKYRPTNFARLDESLVDHYPSPGPGDVYDPVPFLGNLNGLDPNGVWRLYIVDDQPRDEGVMRFGWGITFTELITQNVPVLLEHDAPDLDIVGDIVAPGWTVTRTAHGFVASANASAQADLETIVLQAKTPLTPGDYPVTTTVQPLFGEVNLDNNVVNTSLANSPLSDLAMSGSVKPVGALYGEVITYTFVVVNNGPTTAIDSVLKIVVADELSVTKADASMGSCTISGARVTCNNALMRPLDSGDIMTVTLIADTPGGGLPGPVPIITTATLENGGDPNTGDNQVVLGSTLAEFARSAVYLPVVAR